MAAPSSAVSASHHTSPGSFDFAIWNKWSVKVVIGAAVLGIGAALFYIFSQSVSNSSPTEQPAPPSQPLAALPIPPQATTPTEQPAAIISPQAGEEKIPCIFQIFRKVVPFHAQPGPISLTVMLHNSTHQLLEKRHLIMREDHIAMVASLPKNQRVTVTMEAASSTEPPLTVRTAPKTFTIEADTAMYPIDKFNSLRRMIKLKPIAYSNEVPFKIIDQNPLHFSFVEAEMRRESSLPAHFLQFKNLTPDYKIVKIVLKAFQDLESLTETVALDYFIQPNSELAVSFENIACDWSAAYHLHYHQEIAVDRINPSTLRITQISPTSYRKA